MRDLTGRVVKLEKHYFAHGGLADIYRGNWTHSDGQTQVVAIKVIRESWTSPEHLRKLNRRLTREGNLWSQLCHPAVVPFYGVSYDLGRPGSPSLISPYYQNGNISTYLQRNPGADRLKLVCEVAVGLSYLHSPQIHMVHGDIKASNILVSDDGCALLADFGLTRVLEHSGMTTNIGGEFPPFTLR
jgi:serine/threonine protein kinase